MSRLILATNSRSAESSASGSPAADCEFFLAPLEIHFPSFSQPSSDWYSAQQPSDWPFGLDFVSSVAESLAATGLQAHYLEVELTETFLMQEAKCTFTGMRELRAMGVHLALDDFGTGYSSLSYLQRFPIDTLKIDQSFVRDLISDADDANIVRAVIGMGNSLHMRVIAEGIETRQQLDFLRAQGCPVGQGFYFSRPVPAADFARLLESGLRIDAVAA